MTDTKDGWPPRPAVFPEVLTTVEIAQLLRLDETCRTPEMGARMIRKMVKQDGLPKLRRLGRGLRFAKTAVMAWARQTGT